MGEFLGNTLPEIHDGRGRPSYEQTSADFEGSEGGRSPATFEDGKHVEDGKRVGPSKMLKVSKMANGADVAVLQILASSNCVIRPIGPISPIAYMGLIGRMGRIEGEPMPGRLEMGRRLPDSGESGYRGTVHIALGPR